MASDDTTAWHHRSATLDDAERILGVINEHSRTHCGTDRVGADELPSWFGPDGKPERQDMEIWLTEEGPCAYAQLCSSEWPPTWDVWLDITVHPAAADRPALWDEVIAWAEKATQALVSPRNPEQGHRCGARVLATDSARLRAYARRGYRQVRTETLMRIALEKDALVMPSWPEGIGVRTLDLTIDLEAYALAYGEAFRDHWGHTELPAGELVRKKRGEFRSWGTFYRPELWFVAVDGDEIVGGVGSFVGHGGDPKRSYLYNVFVRRAWRHRGIATALLRKAFQSVHACGCRSAELHVDSENLTWALELYRGVGMRPLWHQHLYEKQLPPANPG